MIINNIYNKDWCIYRKICKNPKNAVFGVLWALWSQDPKIAFWDPFPDLYLINVSERHKIDLIMIKEWSLWDLLCPRSPNLRDPENTVLLDPIFRDPRFGPQPALRTLFWDDNISKRIQRSGVSGSLRSFIYIKDPKDPDSGKLYELGHFDVISPDLSKCPNLGSWDLSPVSLRLVSRSQEPYYISQPKDLRMISESSDRSKVSEISEPFDSKNPQTRPSSGFLESSRS